MRRISYTPYLFLIGLLFVVVSLPFRLTQKMRGVAVSSLAPAWQTLSRVRQAPQEVMELEHLRQENISLRAQINSIRQWLLVEDRLEEQWERLQSLAGHEEGDLFWKGFFKRRSQELVRALDLQLQSLPAKVIFREPVSWSSSLWINVGERNNRSLGRVLVAKNSPVLVGDSIVGVVEDVQECKSRIRLITDSSLVASVRVVRGDQYLAKGELYGSSSPVWRSHRHVLKGVGFNCDYPDAEGPARDLRTGAVSDAAHPGEKAALLASGDLLVTTGLDGVFPAGFRVAAVSKVAQLREGASSYEIEARSTAGNLDELTHVLVLPPLY
jgi:rod shape-determining protein MreC